MPTKKVYGSLTSPATLKVLACLYEHDLEFEFVPIDLKAGEQKKESFLAMNPFGQVPVYTDGDYTLFESRAIIRYMAHQHPKNPEELICWNAKEQGQVAMWVDVEDHQFEPPASKIIWQLVLKHMIIEGVSSPDEKVVAEAEAKLAKVLDLYEAPLTKSKYLAMDKFTIADLLHLPNLHYLMGTPAKALIDSRPHVSAWSADILARPAWAKPFGQIPAYEDGEFKLFESRAICRAIAREYGKKGEELVYEDTKAQGLVDLWIDIEDHQFDSPAGKLVKALVFMPMSGSNPDETEVAEEEAKLAQVLDVYEVELSKFKYLAGDKYTLADMSHLPKLQYLRGTQVQKLFDSRPHVSAWCADILARPAWAMVMEMKNNNPGL